MKKIFDFIKKHHIVTVSGSLDNIPYSATCFYAFNEKEKTLIFASDLSTIHMKIFKKNPYVSGTVFLDTKNVSKIEGIQFQGIFKNSVFIKSKELYFKKFPFSKVMNPPLFEIKLEFIKYTNNALGFGKKIKFGKELF